PKIRALWLSLLPFIGSGGVRVPHSSGQIEALQADLMHFTFQAGFYTDIPSIYQPWDMQHRHWPEYFAPYERVTRDVIYEAFCRQARLVAVASSWTRRDVVRQLDLPEERVQVIPVAAPLKIAQPQPAKPLPKGLPDTFVFYPAQTWPHKNHLAVLEALALLRRRDGLKLPLVCAGREYAPFFSRLLRQVRELHLETQVHFVGYHWPLGEFFARARCLVFPSRFEGFGMPVLEAFAAGVPLACSNATCLPDLAGEAAIIFNPDDPGEIAAALKTLWGDEAVRATLTERGRLRAQDFSWEHTTRLYRAHYRRLTHGKLTLDDRSLLTKRPVV
ncbi:MAG: glycosyltransferase family 4 protein, partial [Anaerolineales bacterium]